MITTALLLVQALVLVSGWSNEVPFWPKYPTRNIQVLDGNWSFAFESKFDEDVTSTRIDVSKIETPESVFVPSVFDYAPPGILGRRGTAFYRTHLDITPNVPALINFAACSFYCQVFVDGKSIGDHRAGGYVPFWLNVPASSSKTREIFVISDNRFNSTTAPLHTGGDFWFFGGIQRSVLVHELPNPEYLVRLEVQNIDTKGTFDLKTIFSEDVKGEAKLSVSINNATAKTYTVTLTNGSATIDNLSVANPKLWDIKKPNLYTVSVTLVNSDNKVLDTIETRFGFRKFAVDTKTRRITINGKIVKLHGYNRHTEWPETGSAVTLPQIKADIAILQDLNCNYVRGAHYPQDQRFLDLADEIGFVVWEEAVGPGVSVKDIQTPYFIQQQEKQIDEMIDASFNHPSVIMFGFFNEGPSNEAAACPGYQASSDAVKRRNTGRFVTWASNMETGDQCLKYADVISFNSYPAWYYSTHNFTAPITHWNSMAQFVHDKFEQPFTISEAGAGGIYEWTNSTPVYWSQLYQVSVVQADIKVALANDFISGVTIWHLFDFKGNDDATKQCGPCTYEPNVQPPICSYINVNCGRPGGLNHKGVVDFWRRKKSLYPIVKSLYDI